MRDLPNGGASGPLSRPPGRVRPGAVHALLFVLSLVVWSAIGIGLSFLIGYALTEDLYLSEQARDAAVSRAARFATAGWGSYAVVTIGLIASRVGYRLRDGFFVLAPIYSLFFVPKMLWRWTAIPDRYWDPVGPSWHAEAPPPPDQRRPAALIAGLLAVVLLAGALGLYVSQRGGEASGSDEWRTTRAQGMSISLPQSFRVFTDPADYAEGAAEVGLPETDELAEMIELFPEFFALAAFEPGPREGDMVYPRATLEVLRLPSGYQPFEESVDLLSEGIEETGFLDVTGQNETTVGTGNYSAVRVRYRLQDLPGFPRLRFVSYIVDGGSQVWFVVFSALSEDYDAWSPTFDRIIASLTLPGAKGDGRQEATAEQDNDDFDGAQGERDIVRDPADLNGAYRVEWTLEELVAAGVPAEVVYDFDMAGTFTWSLFDGQLWFTGEFPDGRTLECGGTYEARRTGIDLKRRSPCPSWVFTANWEATDAGLTFSGTLLDGEPQPILEIWMAQKPWTKID